MSVGNAVRRALYGRMTGDSTLRNLVGAAPVGYNANNKAIYSDVAPAESGTPFVVFFQTSSVPMGDTFGPRGAEVENDLWTIKAVSRDGSADEAEAVQARLDALLTDPTGGLAISGVLAASTVYCRRESDVNYSEVQDGVTYFHRGCVFRLIWQ